MEVTPVTVKIQKLLPRKDLPMKDSSTTQHPSAQLFENLWDIKQTAAALSVPVKTLRDWVYRRRIPFKRVGRLIRFSPSDLQHWIQSEGPSHAHKTD